MKSLLEYRIRKFKRMYYWNPANETIVVDNVTTHLIIIGQTPRNVYLTTLIYGMKHMHCDNSGTIEWDTMINSGSPISISCLEISDHNELEHLYENGRCSPYILTVRLTFFKFPVTIWNPILYHEIGHVRFHFDGLTDKNSGFFKSPKVSEKFGKDQEIYNRFNQTVQKIIEDIFGDIFSKNKCNEIAEEFIADSYAVICTDICSVISMLDYLRLYSMKKYHLKRCGLLDLRIDLLPLIVKSRPFHEFKRVIEEKREAH